MTATANGASPPGPLYFAYDAQERGRTAKGGLTPDPSPSGRGENGKG